MDRPPGTGWDGLLGNAGRRGVVAKRDEPVGIVPGLATGEVNGH